MNRFTGLSTKPNRFNGIDTKRNSATAGDLGSPMDLITGGDDTVGGITRNTILGLPKAAVKVAKDIAQGVARTVGGVGITAGNVPTQIANKVFNEPVLKTKAPLPFDETIDTSQNPVSNAIFGGKPIKTIPKQIESTKETLKPYIGDKASSFASAPLVLGSIALDLSGFGGKSGVKVLGEVSEQFFKNMAKEKSPQVIEETLKKIGLDEVNAKALAHRFAENKSVDEAKQTLIDYGFPTEKAPSTQRLFPERTGTTSPETSIVTSPEAPPIPVKPTVPSPTQAITQAPKSIAGDLSKESSYRDSIQKQILDARDAEQAMEKFKAVEADPLDFPEETEVIRNVAKELNTPEIAPQYKDIGLVKTQFRDIYRNSEQVFGKDFPVIDRTVFQPLEEAKGNLIDFYNNEIQAFKNSPAAKFKRGSPESAAIQEYGEGLIKYDDLVKKFGATKAKAIEDAVPFFRDKYQELIDRVNATEMKIYPNNPAKWTPTLKNYFRHGTNAQGGLAKLQNIYENPIKIDPNLVGLTEETKPLSKWQSFKQRRLTGKDDKPDAVGGFLDYLTNAGYSINIDPHIGKFRALADNLAVNTTRSKNLNNYIMQVRKFADRLAGKSNDIDRAIGGVVGRQNLEAVNWLNNRVKANTVMANVSSSLAQLGNIPQGIANAGIPNSIKALGKTLAQNFVENPAMKQSTFIKERYFKGFDQFDKGMLQNTKKFAKWMITVLDEAGTKFIWNGQYEKGKQLGLSGKELINYADKNAKKLVAGRGIGDLPLIQSSKIFQLAAPFQVEVTNLWWAMEDLAKSDKNFMQKFGQFATLFVSLYYLNNALQKATGNRPLLDPIQTTLDGIQAIEDEPNATGIAKAGGRFAGEVLGNIPFGQTIANYYPEFGGNFMGKQTPTRKEIFGRNDPTRFGSGLLVNKGISDPLFKVLPPFGGSQLKKTIQGLKAVNKGKSTTVNDKFQYKIDKSTSNKIKAGLFGKSSLPETQQYYDKKAGIAPSKTKGLKGTKANRFKGL